jgi:hypothetical protein
MRITWRDGLATAFVAGSTILYVLWLAGSEPLGISSPRMMAVVAFVLGYAGCYTDTRGMMAVYGARGAPRARMPYVILSSALGAAALTTGIAAMITGNGVLIATMVIATVLLWLMATVRKAISGRSAPADHIDRAPRPADAAHR